MSNRVAVIFGASGSVGRPLLEAVVQSGGFSRILGIARRSLDRLSGSVVEQVLVPDMTPGPLTQAVESAVRSLPDGEVLGFSVLGVGANTAKLTLDEHRAVDVELNAAFARGLKASGRVRHLAFMSAVGADVEAKTTGSGAAGMPRYLRVKGESEAAVMREGPAVVSVFRPAMIIGSQHTPKVLEVLLPLFGWLTPKNFRSIRTTEIAQAMVAASLNPPARSAVYHYPEMMALIAGRQAG